MHKMTPVSLLIFPLIGAIFAQNSSLFTDFFLSKGLTRGVIIWCDKPSIDLIKSMSANYIAITVIDDITFLESTNSFKIYQKEAIALDTRCRKSKIVLDQASNQQFFRVQYKWLIIEYGNEIDLSSLDIAIDSDVTVASISKTGYSIQEIHKIGRKSELRRELVLNWTARNVINRSIIRTKDLRGFELIVATVVVNKMKIPLIPYLKNDQDLTSDVMSKHAYAIISILGNIFNFKKKVYRTLTWGYRVNNTIDGMSGMLGNRSADIGCSGMYVREERMDFVDPVAEYRSLKVYLLFKHPRTNGNILEAFLSPLEFDAWIATLCCTIVIIVISIIILSTDKFEILTRIRENDLLTFMFGLYCQQGLTQTLNKLSFKILAMTLLLFSFLLNQFYSASIVSSLLKDPPKTIKTPEDFLNSRLNMKVEDIPYQKIFFGRKYSEVMQKLYHTKVLKGPRSNFVAAEVGVKSMKSGDAGFFVDLDNAYPFIQATFDMSEICDLCQITLLPVKRLVWTTSKGSPYRKLLTYGFRKLYQTGNAKQEEKRWHVPDPKCVKELIQKEFSVDLNNICLLFILLLLGMIASLIILLIEIKYK